MSNSAFTVTGTSQNITFPITVPQGGSGVASFTPYSVIAGGTTSTGPLQQVSGLGTLGQVLTSQGAGTLPQWTTISTSGFVVNRVSTSFSTFASFSCPPLPAYANPNLQNNLNVPINTDGTQIFTLTITPQNASHVLMIESSAIYSTPQASGIESVNMALFMNSNVNAIAAAGSGQSEHSGSNNFAILLPLYIRHFIIAGTISPITFNVRIGPGSGPLSSTIYLNGAYNGSTTGNQTAFGGVSANTYMMITEYTS